MADARLELVLGELRFSAEGSEKWVDQKLSDFLSRTQDTVEQNGTAKKSHRSSSSPNQGKDQTAKITGSLATFIREHNAGGTQVNRFLAAAIWLQRNGAESLKTTDVAKALVDARQQPLKNPADVLNQNVTKGFCVKSGDGFYVTSEGEESLSA